MDNSPCKCCGALKGAEHLENCPEIQHITLIYANEINRRLEEDKVDTPVVVDKTTSIPKED